ncbi:hypothetical protein SLE2022_234580 [Rubroshorea leprosula]
MSPASVRSASGSDDSARSASGSDASAGSVSGLDASLSTVSIDDCSISAPAPAPATHEKWKSIVTAMDHLRKQGNNRRCPRINWNYIDRKGEKERKDWVRLVWELTER